MKIITDPPGAIVNFDGTDLGPAPVEKTIVAGDYLVAARQTGFRQASRVISVKAAGGLVLRFSLRPR